MLTEGVQEKIIDALQAESDYYDTGLVKIYYINAFPVNRAEFLLHFGKPTKEDIDSFRRGESIERNGLQFDVSCWDGL